MSATHRLILLSNYRMHWWAKELSTNPEYGWVGNKNALARALGYAGKHPDTSLRNRARGDDWKVTANERLKFSIGVRRILNGDVVLLPGKLNGQKILLETRVSPPRPPQLARKRQEFYIDKSDLKLKVRNEIPRRLYDPQGLHSERNQPHGGKAHGASGGVCIARRGAELQQS